MALTLTSYFLLGIFIVMRLFIKKKSRSSVFRAVLMLIMMLVSSINLIWVEIDDQRTSTVTVNILNVVILLFFVRAIREVWLSFIHVVIASAPVFAIIFAYFILFIIVGFILFANFEQDDSFATLNDSMYTVFILFTVSNYPDVQLPYFEDQRMDMLYFWSFLIVGIFLLSNLLLAQIFINYKKLIKKKLKLYENQVEEYFRQLFEGILNGQVRNYITVDELKEALGGDKIVEKDKRLGDLFWQSNIILDGKIQF